MSARDRLRAADPKNKTRTDTMPAGRVFVVMLSVLMAAALVNAETMLHRAETSPIGRTRDLKLAFWRPVDAVASRAGLTAPRQGLEALRDGGGTKSEPAELAVDTELAAEGETDLDPGPLGPTKPPPKGRLGHEPLAPTTGPDSSSPTTGPSTGLGPTPPASPSPLDPTLPPDVTVAPDPPATEQDSGASPAAGGLSVDRAPSAEDPLRILLVGDSTMDAVGNSMLRHLADTGVTTATLDFRISTGLARPDFFDWPSNLRTLTASTDAEIIIIMLGANDAQPFLIDNEPEAYGTERWFATYRSRVAGLLDEATADGRSVIWISQPIMRSGDYDARIQRLNQIYAEELARYPNATLIDSRPIMSTDGTYSPYLIDGNGDRQLVRQADGVHLTSAGGDRLSPAVIDQIDRITPVR